MDILWCQLHRVLNGGIWSWVVLAQFRSCQRWSVESMCLFGKSWIIWGLPGGSKWVANQRDASVGWKHISCGIDPIQHVRKRTNGLRMAANARMRVCVDVFRHALHWMLHGEFSFRLVLA